MLYFIGIHDGSIRSAKKKSAYIILYYRSN